MLPIYFVSTLSHGLCTTTQNTRTYACWYIHTAQLTAEWDWSRNLHENHVHALLRHANRGANNSPPSGLSLESRLNHSDGSDPRVVTASSPHILRLFCVAWNRPSRRGGGRSPCTWHQCCVCIQKIVYTMECLLFKIGSDTTAMIQPNKRLTTYSCPIDDSLIWIYTALR